MSQTQRIADAYRAATVKGAWYGPTLAELLAKISPEFATARAVPGAHSISELLQHLLLWNDRVRNTSDDKALPPWEAEKDWAEPAIAWNELVSRWSRSRELLEERILNFPVEDLAKQVPERNYNYETLFHGVVEHTIYHSGQIAMVLSMLQA
jgi:uncharacterized damage-inducible protein DinB